MSRIGKKPIALPAGVTVQIKDRTLVVKGPRGELAFNIHPSILVKEGEGELVCEIARVGKQTSALWGTTRARIANMVEGVSTGFKKQLELQGVGYKAQLEGNNLQLALGYSHPIVFAAPGGISFVVEKEIITIEGNDKQQVGQIAAEIRKLRKPEPYKGKGVRYVGENVRRKVGKVVGTSE